MKLRRSSGLECMLREAKHTHDEPPPTRRCLQPHPHDLKVWKAPRDSVAAASSCPSPLQWEGGRQWPPPLFLQP